MAEKKIIDITIKSNIKSVEKDFITVKNSIEDSTSSAQEFNETANETTSKASGFKDLAGSVVNLVPGLKGATTAGDGLLKKMYALVANPIGLVITAIVLALKFLYESFQSSVKGGKELQAMWAGISGVASQVKDAIFGLGRAFINVAEAAYKFITLDFDGAAKSMKKANDLAAQSYNQLKSAVDGTTFSILQKLEKQQQTVNKARKNLAVTQSETDKLLVKSREILTDETASLKDKKKALEDVTKAETATSKEKVRIAKEDLRIANEKAKALGGEAEKKMKQELRDLTIALNEAETENATTGIKLNKQRKMLNRQETADAKESNDAAKERGEVRTKIKEDELKKIADLEKEYKDSLLTSQQLELLNVKRKYSDQITAAEKHKKDSTLLKEAQKTEEKKINQKYADLEIQKQKELNQKLIELEDKQFDLGQELTQTAKEKEIADLVKQYEAKFEIANGNDELEKQLKEKQEKEIAAINDKYRLAQMTKDEADAQAKKDREKKIKDFYIDAAINTLNILSDLADTFAGKSEKSQRRAFNIQKAASIATTLLETYKAAQSAYASQIVPGDPSSLIRGGIAAGIATAAGLARVAKIAKTQFNTKNDVGGDTPNGAIPQSTQQAPNFSIVGNAAANAQLGQQPLQAYVVSGEVTSAQSLERNRIKTATL